MRQTKKLIRLEDGIIISNTDQSSDSIPFYNAVPTVSDNTAYDSSGKLYTDWQLPNWTQWDLYICTALSSGQLKNIESSFTMAPVIYWTTTLKTPDAVAYVIKLVNVREQASSRITCVTQEVVVSSSIPTGIVRSIRTF